MLRKILFPLFLGIAGCGTLLWLGFWQLDRLAWKEAIIADIDARLAAPHAPLSRFVTEAQNEYTRVLISGSPTGEELHVLDSGTAAGTGYRVISKFMTDIGAVMVDQGLLAIDNKEAAPLTRDMRITGTLLWPDDQNDSTPEPDLAANIWFARNVTTMSQTLGTLPIMVVASQTSPQDPRLTPLPITTAGIKNDHLEYAITWFLLAAVWAIMTLYLIRRTLRPKTED
jgi:surfeit locus 1 family protein